MRIAIVKSRPGLKNLYSSLSADVQAFFGDFPALVDSAFSLDILLAYVFFRMEYGQRLTLYCGARKLHKTESSLTWCALDVQHITREDFRDLFSKIYGFPIDDTTSACIKDAEGIRDRLMHGRDLEESDKREAVSKALQYAERMNDLIERKKAHGLKPFSGDLRGFAGRGESLDKSTTRWILKGMGFTLS